MFFSILLLHIALSICDDPQREITICEACKYLSAELADSFKEYNSSEKLRLSYSFDDDQDAKSLDYRTSETRLEEVMENVCRRILQYSVHAERSGSLRYAKGQSQTMSTLWGLRNRGVKVILDVPNDLWDSPSAEITTLEKKCNILLEKYEDVIEEWYKNHQDIPISKYLCEDRVLINEDKTCLNETYIPEKNTTNTSNEAKSSESPHDDL